MSILMCRHKFNKLWTKVRAFGGHIYCLLSGRVPRPWRLKAFIWGQISEPTWSARVCKQREYRFLLLGTISLFTPGKLGRKRYHVQWGGTTTVGSDLDQTYTAGGEGHFEPPPPPLVYALPDLDPYWAQNTDLSAWYHHLWRRSNTQQKNPNWSVYTWLERGHQDLQSDTLWSFFWDDPQLRWRYHDWRGFCENWPDQSVSYLILVLWFCAWRIWTSESWWQYHA